MHVFVRRATTGVLSSNGYLCTIQWQEEEKNCGGKVNSSAGVCVGER